MRKVVVKRLMGMLIALAVMLSGTTFQPTDSAQASQVNDPAYTLPMNLTASADPVISSSESAPSIQINVNSTNPQTTVSSALSDLIKKGQRVYTKKFVPVVNKYLKAVKNHNRANQKESLRALKVVWRGLTAHQKKAVKAYLKRGKTLASTSAYSPDCNPLRERCPLSVVKGNTLVITPAVELPPSRGCSDWNFWLWERLPPWNISADSFPSYAGADPYAVYQYEVNTHYCWADGKVTSFDVVPKLVSLSPLAAYKGIVTERKTALDKAEFSYFIQFEVSVSAPIIAQWVGYQLHPWVELTVDGEGYAGAGWSQS